MKISFAPNIIVHIVHIVVLNPGTSTDAIWKVANVLQLSKLEICCGYMWNKIISEFYFTCNHVWNWNKIISATEGVLKLSLNYFGNSEHVGKYLWAAINLWNNFRHVSTCWNKIISDRCWQRLKKIRSNIIAQATTELHWCVWCSMGRFDKAQQQSANLPRTVNTDETRRSSSTVHRSAKDNDHLIFAYYLHAKCDMSNEN